MSTQLGDVVDVIRFAGTDTHLFDDLYEGFAASFRYDCPGEPVVGREAIEVMLGNTPHGLDAEFYGAIVNGRFAGFALMFMQTKENRHLVSVELATYVGWRRRGIGRRLVEQVTRRAQELGRTTLVSRATENPAGGDPAAGAAFAAAMGAKAAMTEVKRRLELSMMDHGAYATMLADCWERADGYDIVQWTDGVDGGAPEEYVDDLARLQVRLDTDAPKGDLNMEAREPDPEYLRGNTIRVGKAGFRQIHTAVRHIASGRIVAWTMISTKPSDRGYGQQDITVVDPDHRGLRLGTLVKLENLTYARKVEPTLRLVETSNAGENRHMIAINEALGFTVHGRVHNFQKEL